MTCEPAQVSTMVSLRPGEGPRRSICGHMAFELPTTPHLDRIESAGGAAHAALRGRA